MSSCEWDFKLVPKDQVENIKQLVIDGDAIELIKIHNKYMLSTNQYCCGGGKQAVITWFTYAIENNLI